MDQEVVFTRGTDVEQAVKDLARQLKKKPAEYQAVIFLAASMYDFEKLSAEMKKVFADCEVIGTSTAGEITGAGFANDTIVLTTMSKCADTKVKGVLVEEGSRYPVVSKVQIEDALSACGIRCGDPNSHKDAFAIAFINGVYNGEETVLANFYSIIKNDNFKLAGGTAGYTGDTPKTFVSYNGKVTQDGAAMLFVKTQCKFDIRQEDIFNPTGKTITVTQSDPVNRNIKSFDGKAAKTVYAEMLGVTEAQAEGMTFENPFGRFLNGQMYIAALAGFNPDKSISTFARVVPNSTIELMHIGDPLEKADQTMNGIKEVISKPKFALLMTCVTRTVAFAKMNISGKIIEKYNSVFPQFAGFSAYGEQHNRIHCNQTLVSVVMGE